MGAAEGWGPQADLFGMRKEVTEAHDSYEREVRDLPWRKYRATVIIELYRVRCPQCGVRIEKVGRLPSKAPFSKDFEDAVGLACESASVRQVARQFGLAASTVRAIDLRYLQRWNARRRKDRLKQIGVDEIYFGKQTKFITVVSNLETGEPLWFGRDRKQETLDEFFRTQLKESQRKRIEAACVDMWRPFATSIEQWAPNCRIVYDKFHVLQHANKAIDEVRRAEFFRKGGRMRGVVKGKRWLLDSLDESGRPKTPAVKPAIRPQPEGDESLPIKGKLGAVVELPLRRSHAALSPKLDRSAAVATVGTVSKPRFHVAGSFRGHPQLLPHQSTLRSGGSHQRQHQNPSPKGPRLQKSRLPAAQGPTHGGHQDRIYRSSKSSLKCGSLRILAQSRIFKR